MINLDMSKQKLKLQLQKANVNTINPCQVSFALDVSGSFDDEHERGYTQELLNRIVPFALLFDKDGELDSFAFSSKTEKTIPATEDNIEDFISKVIQKTGCYGLGTNYLPAFKALVENGTEGEEKKGLWGFLSKGSKKVSRGKQLSFFITDGEAYDQNTAKEWLEENISEEHFIVFITIGSEFKFFRNNYSNTEFSSYHHMTIDELRKLKNKSDEDLYEQFVTANLADWANK